MDSGQPSPGRTGVPPPSSGGTTSFENFGSRPWSWWPRLKKMAGAAFLLAVLALLVSQARNIEWHKVAGALADYPVTTVYGAALLALLSFAIYSCFDLLGRRYTGHRLGNRAVMTTGFVSYVFNLNLGSLVGGVATRYRLYSRLGLPTGVITRVMSLSMLTNWMGYLLLAGLLFSVTPPALPESWKIGASQLRFIGFGLLGLAIAYLAACFFRRARHVQVRGHQIDLPTAPLAALQLPLGAANWLVMSAIMFILLQHRIEFALVAGVLLLAAVAGLVTHIPGNLGVLEGVFVALLSHKMAQHEVLAAVVGYRVVYYLVPLGVASVVYLVMEAHGRKMQVQIDPGTA